MSSAVNNHVRRAIALAATLALVGTSHAAQLSYTLTAPLPDADDVSNFTGAMLDRNNVGGDGTTDGGGNDGSTYVAFDRATQGQTFTTGANVGGYRVVSIWLQHAGYSGNTDLTYYYIPVGSTFDVRLTDPAQAGSAGFVIDSESYTTTGAETDTLPTGAIMSSADGTGTWLRFGFDTPPTVAANTQYGFDVTSILTSGFNFDGFFETLGTSSDVYAGGSAYNGGTVGAPDLALNPLAGDRVFVVELRAVPEPATAALMGLGGLGLLSRRRRQG